MKIPRLGDALRAQSCSLVLCLPAVHYRMTARVLRRLYIAEINGIYVSYVKFSVLDRWVQN